MTFKNALGAAVCGLGLACGSPENYIIHNAGEKPNDYKEIVEQILESVRAGGNPINVLNFADCLSGEEELKKVRENLRAAAVASTGVTVVWMIDLPRGFSYNNPKLWDLAELKGAQQKAAYALYIVTYSKAKKVCEDKWAREPPKCSPVLVDTLNETSAFFLKDGKNYVINSRKGRHFQIADVSYLAYLTAVDKWYQADCSQEVHTMEDAAQQLIGLYRKDNGFPPPWVQ